MNYEKTYKEAIERAKGAHNSAKSDKENGVTDKITEYTIQLTETIFPELAESEDEKIRKQIKAFIKSRGSQITQSKTDAWITWLEKQGEQKLVDKVETKFNVGDWVVTDKGDTVQIGAVNNGYYTLHNGMDFNISYIDKCWRKWTIEDAKDGDVLVYGDNPNDHHVEIIMIFKSLRNKVSAFTHFHIFNKMFRIDNSCDCGKSAHPATKEQRDLLFQKMKKAGYKWNEDKKELIKL